VEGTSDNEYLILLRDLAPHESDGPDDSQEWNLFDSYLNGGEDSLNNPHDLSDMLNNWENDVVRSWLSISVFSYNQFLYALCPI